MKKIKQYIAFLAVLSLLLGFTQVFASSIPVVPSVFDTSLASPIASSDSLMTLSSGTLRDGTSLSGYTCFTIDESTPTLEYVCGTVSGTTVSSLTRGIDPISGTTTVSSLRYSHRRGADVKISDYPFVALIGRMLSGIDVVPALVSYDPTVSTSSPANGNLIDYAIGKTLANTASTSALASVQTNANTFTGNNVFQTGTLTLSNGFTAGANSTLNGNFQINGTLGVTGTTTLTKSMTVGYDPSNSLDVATKHYVDNVAISGAPNSSETVNGISQLATKAQIAAGTSSGSTGGRLVIPASAATSTLQVATTSIVATLTNGYIDHSFIDGTTTADTLFGSGSDGDVTIGSPTTLTRDMYYHNLTLSSTLSTGNYRVFVSGTVSGSGTIQSNGADASGTTGGATTTGYFITPAGGNGAAAPSAGSPGSNGSNSVAYAISFNSSLLSGRGGAGGTGSSAGGTAGTIGADVGTSTPYGIVAAQTIQATDAATTTGQIFRLTNGAAASGGAAGGAAAGGPGGAGGGGGASGGVMFLAARNLSGTFTAKAVGGAGANGTSCSTSNCGGGGGGGGGKGGVVIMISPNNTWSGSCTVTGGSNGTGGTATGTGTSGSNGNSGATGMCLTIDARTLIR